MCTEWFTLSMADNHWRDLYEMLIRDEKGRPTEFPTFSSVQEEASWKRKLVRKNPHLVDEYFYHRVQLLFQELYGPNGIELDWLWFRIEYQGRGAPHVHGCLRVKRDPGIAEHAKKVLDGRLAALQLRTHDLLSDEEDFPQHELELDTWDDKFIEEIYETPPSPGEIDALKQKVATAKESHRVITAYHDYFFSTQNLDPPSDAEKSTRDDATIFDARTTNVPHPSSVNPLSVWHDEAALEGLYCQDCNVQMRHKHQEYCDRNWGKRELAKQKLREGTLGPREKRPWNIECDCRFEYHKPIRPKTHVYIEQKMTKKNGRVAFVNRIKLAGKRNDGWLNSHKRVVMEVRIHMSQVHFSHWFNLFALTHVILPYFDRFGVRIWIGKWFLIQASSLNT